MGYYRSSGQQLAVRMTPAERTKLAAIEASATGDQTNAELLLGVHGTDSVVVDTTTAYLTTDADNGKTITMNNASASTFKIHAGAPVGFYVKVVQIGVGKVTASMNAGGNLNTNEAGLIMNQNDVAEFVVVSNAGTAPEVYAWGGLNAT